MPHLPRIACGAAVVLSLAAQWPRITHAQATTPVVKNIVLVHGAFADATSWSRVIPLLEADGYHVSAVQNPLTSFADDVAATRRLIALQEGPVLLVAHSWGGAVITQAGDVPKVVGLVYVSAYAPDAGQSANDASAPYGWTEGQKQIRLDSAKFATETFQGVSQDIAQKLPLADQKLFFATQGQSYGPMFDEKLTVAAWTTKPTWVLISSNDRMLPPAMEQAEVARLKAVASMTLPTGHMSIQEEPAKVVALIEAAAHYSGSK
jgi:pimeloyl-ACP methyl ester carboxylesterase